MISSSYILFVHNQVLASSVAPSLRGRATGGSRDGPGAFVWDEAPDFGKKSILNGGTGSVLSPLTYLDLIQSRSHESSVQEARMVISGARTRFWLAKLEQLRNGDFEIANKVRKLKMIFVSSNDSSYLSTHYISCLVSLFLSTES